MESGIPPQYVAVTVERTHRPVVLVRAVKGPNDAVFTGMWTSICVFISFWLILTIIVSFM